MKLVCYDALLPESDRCSKRKHRVVLAALPALFAVLGLVAIFWMDADNMPGPATSALPAAGNIAHNFSSWFRNGFWHAANTPAPLYYTAIALVFRVFGYAPAFAMAATCLLSAMACLAIGSIACRRFGPLGGLMAQALYVSNPLMLKISLCSGYYIWGLAPVFVAIELLDRYHLTKWRPYYFAAAMAFLCAGMCRPENFVLVLAPLMLISVPIGSRIAFSGLAWSYPLLSTLYTMIYKLNIPNSDVGRSSDSLLGVFIKWVQLSWRLLGQNQVGMHWVFLGIAMLVIGIVGRTRFLSLIGFLLWPFFCLLDLTSWGEPYMAHHYYLVSAFLLIFAAGAVVELARPIQRFARTFLPPKGMPVLYVALGAIVLTALTPIHRAQALRAVLTSQIRPDAREARNFLRKSANPSEGIVVDCSGEITWLMAELSNEKRAMWAYYCVHAPKPFSDPRDDDESIRVYNEYIGTDFKAWLSASRPSWLITASQVDWTKNDKNTNWRSISLRPVLGRNSFGASCEIALESFTLRLERRYENNAYAVYRMDYSPPNPEAVLPDDNLLVNGNFKIWEGSRLTGWSTLYGATIAPFPMPTGENAVEIRAATPEKYAGLVQKLSNAAIMSGGKFRVTMRAWSADPGKMGVNVYHWANGVKEVDTLAHPGDGQWHDLQCLVDLSATTPDKPVELLIANRAGARSTARIFSIRVELEK